MTPGKKTTAPTLAQMAAIASVFAADLHGVPRPSRGRYRGTDQTSKPKGPAGNYKKRKKK